MGVTVTVAGTTFELDRRSVEERLQDVLPDPLVDHYVAVGGRRYPPKQVVAAVTGLDRADFTTHHARRILRRLGFHVGRKADVVGQPRERSELGPQGRAEVEALRPYVGQWVAQKGLEVLVAADTPEEVLDWLERHDVYADMMFRVPDKPETWDVPAAGPY